MARIKYKNLLSTPKKAQCSSSTKKKQTKLSKDFLGIFP